MRACEHHADIARLVGVRKGGYTRTVLRRGMWASSHPIGHEVIEVSVGLGLGCRLILLVLAAHYDLQRIIR
jgi:hypothetical protein